MSKWDNMDKNAWNNSEVMAELEKKIISAMRELETKINTIKEAQDNAQQVSQKMQQITKDVDTAAKSMTSFLDKAKNLAEDKDLMDEIDAEESLEEDISEEDYASAKEELLGELRKMEIAASCNLDYKLSYKIERAIDALLYDEE